MLWKTREKRLIHGGSSLSLKSINNAGGILARIYDAEIRHASKDKDDKLVDRLNEERERLFVVVGRWECEGHNFLRGQKLHWVLYADGSVKRDRNANGALPKGWWFTPNGMMIKNFAPGAPKGGYDDSCQLSWDGQLMEVKNQVGGVYTGRLQ